MKILETVLLYLICLLVIVTFFFGEQFKGNTLSIAFISTIASILINRFVINMRRA